MVKKNSTRALCAVWAALIAYSRMYLGQHYLRDLVGGLVIAVIVLFLYTLLHKKIIPDQNIA